MSSPSVISGDLSKFGRGDASSPAPATTLAQTQQNQTQTHHTTQQPFLNPALPPGYSYTSLPYYTGMPGLPNTFQYGPAVFPVRIPDPYETADFHSAPLYMIWAAFELYYNLFPTESWRLSPFRWLLPRPNNTVWMLVSMHQPHPSSRLVVMVPMDTALVRQ